MDLDCKACLKKFMISYAMERRKWNLHKDFWSRHQAPSKTENHFFRISVLVLKFESSEWHWDPFFCMISTRSLLCTIVRRFEVEVFQNQPTLRGPWEHVGHCSYCPLSSQIPICDMLQSLQLNKQHSLTSKGLSLTKRHTIDGYTQG